MIPHSARRAAERSAGFSLIEVLVAITIIGLMVGVVGFNVFGAFFETQRDKASQEIAVFAQAVKQYRLKESRALPASEWPTALIKGSKNYKRPYLDTDKIEGDRLLDPWGNEYVYKPMSSGFDIISYGEDGIAGGEGDAADIHHLPEDKRR